MWRQRQAPPRPARRWDLSPEKVAQALPEALELLAALEFRTPDEALEAAERVFGECWRAESIEAAFSRMGNLILAEVHLAAHLVRFIAGDGNPETPNPAVTEELLQLLGVAIQREVA